MDKIKLFEVRPDEMGAIGRVAHAAGVEVACDERALTVDGVDAVDGFSAISILGKTVLDAPLAAELAHRGVRYVSTRTIGFNHIDLDACRAAGIRVCNAAYPPAGVAEFAVMLMLIALRRYKPALWRQQVNDYSLGGLEGRELGRQTVGVVGAGRIGRAVMEILSGFGCRLLAYDPAPVGELPAGARLVSLDELYDQSDIVTLHVPLMDSTRQMIDADAVARMRDGVVLVNVSRGELMDAEAVIAAVESEKIGALAMDVFEDEDGIYHESRVNDIIANRRMAYLRQFPNVVLTQHMAFYTDVNVESMVECGIQGVIDMERGRCATELR